MRAKDQTEGSIQVIIDSINNPLSDATAPPQAGSSTALSTMFTNESINELVSDATAPPPGSSTEHNSEITIDSVSELVSNATAPLQAGSSTVPSKEVPYDPVVDWMIQSDATAQPPALNCVESNDDKIIESIFESSKVANATSTPSSPIRIPSVPQTVRDKHDYQKYFVPEAVSIGPYHFGKPKLQSVENLKPQITMKLLQDNRETLSKIYGNLVKPEMVQELREYYNENSTAKFSDKEFTKMMLLDSCFILYFIIFMSDDGDPDLKSIISGCGASDYSELKSNEIFIVRRDLFLLENQIPFKVLNEVTRIMGKDWSDLINQFIDDSSFVKRKTQKRNWIVSVFIGSYVDDKEPDHLLDAVHGKHSRIVKAPTETFNPYKFYGHNFRNVSELADVGIYFKPMKNTLSMTHIEFTKSWWGFSAYVKLPPIATNDYTRPMLLNLMAYETCLCSIKLSWVTSYVYLLGYLIDDVNDVKLLRNAWVLENYLASDQEVVKLFDDIGIDLVEYSSEYLEAKRKIQRHYQSSRNRLVFQLKNEYFKSPWAYVALLGAFIALFLTGVQTYYTVWSSNT